MKLTNQSATMLAIKSFDDLPDDARVGINIVELLIGRSRATIFRYVKSGILPSPIRPPGTQNSWRVGDLRRALKTEVEAVV